MSPIIGKDRIRTELALLVQSLAPERNRQFELYWDILGPHLETILERGLPVPKKRSGWLAAEFHFFGSSEGDQVGNLMLAAVGSWAEAARSGAADKQAISAIVSSYVRSMKTLTPFRQGIEDFVGHMVLESRGSASGVLEGAAGARLETFFEVYTEGMRKPTVENESEVAERGKRKDEYDLWMDEDSGEILINGKDMSGLSRQLRVFLGFLLRNMGREISNADIEEELWPGGDTEKRHIPQLFRRLHLKTDSVLERSIIPIERGESRVLKPNVSYCLIRRLGP